MTHPVWGDDHSHSMPQFMRGNQLHFAMNHGADVWTLSAAIENAESVDLDLTSLADLLVQARALLATKIRAAAPPAHAALVETEQESLLG